MIRSKGIGVFFVTQNPTDLPDGVLAQLGNRVQHALRAFTPNDKKALRDTADTFPETEFYDVRATLQGLGTGEALVSVLDPDGSPTPTVATRMVAPRSTMDPVTAAQAHQVAAGGDLGDKYAAEVDRESAHEVLAARLATAESRAEEDEHEGGRAIRRSSRTGKRGWCHRRGSRAGWRFGAVSEQLGHDRGHRGRRDTARQEGAGAQRRQGPAELARDPGALTAGGMGPCPLAATTSLVSSAGTTYRRACARRRCARRAGSRRTTPPDRVAPAIDRGHHMTATVYALANQKGGVGKTTSAQSIAIALAELGRAVLVVDGDPQGSLTFSLGLDPDELEPTLNDVVAGRVAMVDTVLQTEHLDLVPANIDLAGAEITLLSRTGREYLMRGELADLLDSYDDILIDCSPSLGVLTINALTAADEVIIPVQAETLSHRGVSQLLETIDDVRRLTNRSLQVQGCGRHDVRRTDQACPRRPDRPARALRPGADRCAGAQVRALRGGTCGGGIGADGIRPQHPRNRCVSHDRPGTGGRARVRRVVGAGAMDTRRSRRRPRDRRMSDRAGTDHAFDRAAKGATPRPCP